MTFGQKLRELREANGMSRETLSVASDVTFSTIHGYEMDRRSPSLAIAQKLAAALGVSCEAFAECEDVKGEEAKPAKKGKK